MNWINIGISLLISFTTVILASQLIVRISHRRLAPKPILVKSEHVFRKRR